MAWLPVIDISEHQGAVNFRTMRSRGVRLLIMRVSHGHKRDARFASYYAAAREAGYGAKEIAFYSFINPKRGSAEFTAGVAATFIEEVTGRQDVSYMLDIESYRNESPFIGTAVPPSELSRYIRDHMKAFFVMMPGCYQFAYSNRAFWNGSDGPQDSVLAAALEWLVPRYPLYSDKAYMEKGYPPEPSQWDEYAFRLASGPIAPIGATRWHGWQFSAGFNKQGSKYGCQSSDLDLNFIDSEVADRWFPSEIVVPIPPPIPVPPIQAKEPDVLIPHRGVRLFNQKVLADTPTWIQAAPGTPAEATGIAINITFNGSLRPGFATLWEGGGEPPNVSQINWAATAVPSNGFTVVPLNGGGFVVQAIEEVNLIFDQVGYTMPPVKGDKGDPGPPGTGTTDEHIRAVVAQSIANG